MQTSSGGDVVNFGTILRVVARDDEACAETVFVGIA